MTEGRLVRALIPSLVHGWLCLVLASTGSAAEPPPSVTAAERAAAFLNVSAADQRAHLHNDPLTWLFVAEQFEWQAGSEDDALKWDVTARIGFDTKRVWLRDEGEHVSGDQVENRVELLWGHAISARWDLVAGVRHDDGDTPSRTYAAIGVLGLGPEWSHIEVTGYIGNYAHAGLRLKADYDWLITDRLVLTTRATGEMWTDDHARVRIGSGPIQVAAGLRLRYEVWREFAPYVGYEWERLLDDTAAQAEAAGEDPQRSSWVAGVRFWF